MMVVGSGAVSEKAVENRLGKVDDKDEVARFSTLIGFRGELGWAAGRRVSRWPRPTVEAKGIGKLVQFIEEETTGHQRKINSREKEYHTLNHAN